MPRRNFPRLTAASQRLQAVLEASSVDGVWEWDHNRRVAVYDRGAAHYLAGDAELAERELVAETAMAMIHPDDVPWLREQTVRAAHRGGLVIAEYRVLTQDGEIRWILSRGRTQDNAGKPSITRGILIDITQSRELGTGYVVATENRATGTVEQIADHAIALKRLLGTHPSSPLSLIVDMLLLQVGRELAQQHEVSDRTLQ